MTDFEKNSNLIFTGKFMGVMKNKSLDYDLIIVSIILKGLIALRACG